MLSTRDVLAVLTQLHEGVRGLGAAADLVRDPDLRKTVDALQQRMGSVIDDVERRARRVGITPSVAILPRPIIGASVS